MIDKARVHYAITDTGGYSPNVVQSEAKAIYLIRAPKVGQAAELYKRVDKIAEGAAIMTETTYSRAADQSPVRIWFPTGFWSRRFTKRCRR